MHKLSYRRYLARYIRLSLVGVIQLGFFANAWSGTIANVPLISYYAGPHNVLVILDTSTKMNMATNGITAVGGDSPNSKSEIARQALRDLIDRYTGSPTINLGLMSYGGVPSASAVPALSSGYLQSSGTVSSTPVTSNRAFYYASTPLPGKGYLQVPVRPLDASQALTLKNKLACHIPTDPGLCSAGGIANTGGNLSGTWRGSALPGALATASDYLNGAILTPPTTFTNPKEGYTGSTYPAGVTYVPTYPSGPATPPSACENTTIVLSGSWPDIKADGSAYNPNFNSLTDPTVSGFYNLGSKNLNNSSFRSSAYPIAFTTAAGVPKTTQNGLGSLDVLAYRGSTVGLTEARAYYASDKATLDIALNEVMTQALYGIASLPGQLNVSSSSPTNSTNARTSALIYQAQFIGHPVWYGNLKVFQIDPTTGQLANGGAEIWSVIAGENSLARPANAAESAALLARRKIFSYDPLLSASNKGIIFDWANLNATQQLLLGYNFDPRWLTLPFTADEKMRLGTRLVNYLKGDTTYENLSAANRYFISSSFQKVRAPRGSGLTVLGDIVNSDPVFVGGPIMDTMCCRRVCLAPIIPIRYS